MFTKPAGTFLLRPHDANPDGAVYLSFKCASNEDSNGTADSQASSSGAQPSPSGRGSTVSAVSIEDMQRLVNHAVIRRERRTPDAESASTYSYRCGSVGPKLSIYELLKYAF